MSISYGWEKLNIAIHSLCGKGSQAERLLNAVAYNLIHITPENDLPEDIQDEFKKFMHKITLEKLGIRKNLHLGYHY